ncbi:hypothetical protein [Bowmanella yangjiangensis]|uniref:Uncharacterized protein n=1 Tax=Bowmanella yangjiangensis TaxID=2811230 RepID=A0ABS3CMQ5_9ALTE|nr:hypothetical protein [Bowmanella yangjiangensis]MBN7818392.1 hypothetical protein [Bowmanella yangjiangensis]
MTEQIPTHPFKATAPLHSPLGQANPSDVSPHWPKALVQSAVFLKKSQPADIVEIVMDSKQP